MKSKLIEDMNTICIFLCCTNISDFFFLHIRWFDDSKRSDANERAKETDRQTRMHKNNRLYSSLSDCPVLLVSFSCSRQCWSMAFCSFEWLCDLRSWNKMHKMWKVMAKKTAQRCHWFCEDFSLLLLLFLFSSQTHSLALTSSQPPSFSYPIYSHTSAMRIYCYVYSYGVRNANTTSSTSSLFRSSLYLLVPMCDCDSVCVCVCVAVHGRAIAARNVKWVTEIWKRQPCRYRYQLLRIAKFLCTCFHFECIILRGVCVCERSLVSVCMCTDVSIEAIQRVYVCVCGCV